MDLYTKFGVLKRFLAGWHTFSPEEREVIAEFERGQAEGWGVGDSQLKAWIAASQAVQEKYKK